MHEINFKNMEKKDVLNKGFGSFITGFVLSKAILEDYAKVMATLTEASEEEITTRVRTRADELFKVFKDELNQAVEEIKPEAP